MPAPVILPQLAVPVACEADVVVVGAGPGGFAAALQAARMGARVVVVERHNMPGGVHTSGLQGSAGAGVGGIHSELMERFAKAGIVYTATEETHPGWAGNPLSHYERLMKPGTDFKRMSFNPEAAGCIMAEMLQEAGVVALYGISFVDAVVESGPGNSTISAIVVEGSGGRQAIAGRIFIEGSGTAELAARAGVPFVRGGGGQPETATGWDGVDRPIPGGLLWIMTGVDFQRLRRHQETAKDPLLEKVMAEAVAAGDLPAGFYRPRMAGRNVYGDLYIGHPTLDMSPIAEHGTYVLWQNVPYEWALHMDDDMGDRVRAEGALRGFIAVEAAFLRRYVPGFEQAEIANVGRFVGVRDGRHPVGEHVLSSGGCPRRPQLPRCGDQADDQAVPLGRLREAHLRGVLPQLPAQGRRQSAADRRVPVVHLRDHLHGDAELPLVHPDRRDCRLRRRAVHRQEDQAQGAGLRHALFLSRRLG